MLSWRFILKRIEFSALLLGLLTGSAHAYTEYAVSGLSKAANSTVICSATWLRSGSLCAIVSAAHCFNKNDRFATIHTVQGKITLPIAALDYSKDMALFYPPDSHALCRSLSETKQNLSSIMHISQPYIADGWLPQGLSRQDVKSDAFRAQKLSMVPYGMPGLDYTIQVEPLELMNGMSGGAFASPNGIFWGLLIQNEPGFNYSYIIPVEAVQKYILEPSDLREIPVRAQSRRKPTGNNNHADNTGENQQQAQFADLIEQDEGVRVADGRIVIGIDKFSVDGTDDWRFLHGDEKEKKWIVRHSDGYPERKVREGILQRIGGIFRAYSSVRTDIFVQNADGRLLRTDKNARAALDIKIDTRELTLYFPFGRRPFAAENFNTQKEEKYTWSMSFENDAKNIMLRSATSSLSCHNNNYQKLVCRGERESLSLAFDYLRDGIRLRWAIKQNDATVLLVFGDLSRRR